MVDTVTEAEKQSDTVAVQMVDTATEAEQEMDVVSE